MEGSIPICSLETSRSPSNEQVLEFFSPFLAETQKRTRTLHVIYIFIKKTPGTQYITRGSERNKGIQ